MSLDTVVPFPSITVLLVEDQDLVAEALRRAIDAEANLHVVGVVGTVRDAVRSARELRPLVVVMDYGLPDGTGVQAARSIKDESPDIEVIMLTGHGSGATLADALDAGCSGFVPKEAHFSELTNAIVSVTAGQVQVPANLMTQLVSHMHARDDVSPDHLTTRELEVLRHLSCGESTKSISAELFLSIHTVRNHIANVMEKLGAKTRLEAVAIAVRSGLIIMRAQ